MLGDQRVTDATETNTSRLGLLCAEDGLSARNMRSKSLESCNARARLASRSRMQNQALKLPKSAPSAQVYQGNSVQAYSCLKFVKQRTRSSFLELQLWERFDRCSCLHTVMQIYPRTKQRRDCSRLRWCQDGPWPLVTHASVHRCTRKV